MSLFEKFDAKSQELNQVQLRVDKAFAEIEQRLSDTGAGDNVVKPDGGPGRQIYQVSTSDRYVLANTQYGNLIVSLPLPEQEQTVLVKNDGATDGTVIVLVEDGQDVDGMNEFHLRSYEYVTLLCTGIKWTKVG
jgi:hypothetical protein